MKKKGTIGIVATLGLGLCAYALSQQTTSQGREKESDSVPRRQKRKRHRLTPAKRKIASKRSMPRKRPRQSRLSSRLQMKALSLLMGIIFITTAGRSHLMPSLVKS